MALLRPFAALRPSPQRAAEVASVPYDVVSTEEGRRLASRNPWSFLHVTRPDIGLPEGADPFGEAAYAAAAREFDRIRREAPLSKDGPSLYLYRLRVGDHEQTGLAGTWSLDEYESGLIRRHEGTRPDKEDDRTRHMLALRAQTGTVFLTYRDRAEIRRLVDVQCAR